MLSMVMDGYHSYVKSRMVIECCPWLWIVIDCYTWLWTVIIGYV